MKFDFHLQEVCGKIAKSVGILYALKPFLPISALISVYYSLIYPYLNYCILLWGGTCQTHLRPLILLQKRCVRLITKSSYLAHTDPIFRKYNLLKVMDLYKYRLGIYAYSNQVTLSLNHCRNHNYETRCRTQLLPVFQRLNESQKSLKFAVPREWNSIPDYIKRSNTLNQFKKTYKKYLIEQYDFGEYIWILPNSPNLIFFSSYAKSFACVMLSF